MNEIEFSGKLIDLLDGMKHMPDKQRLELGTVAVCYFALMAGDTPDRALAICQSIQPKTLKAMYIRPSRSSVDLRVADSPEPQCRWNTRAASAARVNTMTFSSIRLLETIVLLATIAGGITAAACFIMGASSEPAILLFSEAAGTYAAASVLRRRFNDEN
jgi:hypothetical protein